MTQDEIIEMLKESDLDFLLGDNWMLHHELEHFAKLVVFKVMAQPERSAPCAKHCEATAFQITIKNLEAQLAQRTWVGLTDEEVEGYWDWEDFQCGAGRSTILEMVRDIEAKLKEKNCAG